MPNVKIIKKQDLLSLAESFAPGTVKRIGKEIKKLQPAPGQQTDWEIWFQQEADIDRDMTGVVLNKHVVMTELNDERIVYVDIKQAKKEMGWKKLTDSRRQFLNNLLRQEIKEYNHAMKDPAQRYIDED